MELSIFCLLHFHKHWNGPVAMMIQLNVVVTGSIPGHKLIGPMEMMLQPNFVVCGLIPCLEPFFLLIFIV
jgi:hypothetical protein